MDAGVDAEAIFFVLKFLPVLTDERRIVYRVRGKHRLTSFGIRPE